MTDDIIAPDNVLICCPKVQFKLAPVANCKHCQYFNGLADRFPGSQLSFAARYQILCSKEPIKRTVMEFVANDSEVRA